MPIYYKFDFKTLFYYYELKLNIKKKEQSSFFIFIQVENLCIHVIHGIKKTLTFFCQLVLIFHFYYSKKNLKNLMILNWKNKENQFVQFISFLFV